MKENIKVQGYVLLDVDVVALNNAGKDTMSVSVRILGHYEFGTLKNS